MFFFIKVVDLSTSYQMPFAVCRSNVCFLISEGGRKGPRPESNLSKPARNRINMCTEGGIACTATCFSRISQKRPCAAPPNLGYLHTNRKYTLCANFDFPGQKVRSPGQVKFRCALRDWSEASNLKIVLWALF